MTPVMPGGSQERVSIVAVEAVHGDVRTAVRRALDAVHFRQVLPAGGPVSLKVNLGWDLFIPGSITSPLVAEALILELRDHVGKIYMVEADQVLENIERAYQDSGMADVCRKHDVQQFFHFVSWPCVKRVISRIFHGGSGSTGPKAGN
jgi:uncharacterized protein (DUF362 family)